jgi:hypothetical protein
MNSQKFLCAQRMRTIFPRAIIIHAHAEAGVPRSQGYSSLRLLPEGIANPSWNGILLIRRKFSDS